MGIVGLSISVNFADILENTIEHNKMILDEYVVITTTNDKDTQECCNKYNIQCFTIEQEKINKGELINCGLSYYYLKYRSSKNVWYLIFDSDIILNPKQKELDLTCLNRNSIYGCKRLNIDTPKNLQRIILKNTINFKIASKIFNDYYFSKPGIGYYQLFNKRKYYLYNYDTINYTDSYFRKSFQKIQQLDFFVIHLGRPEANWFGRKSKIWRKVYGFQNETIGSEMERTRG